MNYELLENNQVVLSGEVVSEITYSHEVFNEAFYTFVLSVERLSKEADLIPVTISEKLLAVRPLKSNDKISLKGQFRSYNKQMDGHSKLVLTVFVRELLEYDETLNPNLVTLQGYICKEPIYRTTPFNREITDVLIACNRAYNKSDYIPAIAWGRNARFVASLPVGSKVNISGRVQSRVYNKTLETGEVISKTAYEVSIFKISVE